ncbi:response regulator [Pseudomarimonas arenosa]|uniref:Response regulator n=1 Tax=Pseudomarimonas arenosa TaxID=2774145 RepID=A0AAW3ZEJ0_9GAMM|nr:response regulator [Pseudomarimonas arenosa]MBD8524536.1 response regulator [Pseudomarimonas arenosa]
MTNVLLIDDHALVRAGFKAILEGEPGFTIVGEAENGESGLRMARSLRPDVVICDLHLPGLSGLEVTERIRQSMPELKVMIVTVQEEGPLPRRLLDAGAHGYVVKACERKEFIHALREVSLGRRYLSASIAQRLALESVNAPKGKSPFDSLTARELEITRMFCLGRRAVDIAESLSLSPKTIATHKTRLLAKLGVGDLVSLSRMARAYGLFDPNVE